MKGWRLAWRFLKRDLAAGEVRVLLAALALAVMAVTSVAFVTERAQRALAMESNRLLGGDVLLRADEPIGKVPFEVVRELGLRMAETWTFRSMVRADEGLHLFEVRALGEGFPLRGEYQLDAGEGEFASREIPQPGAVWVSRGGAQRLGLKVGDSVKLGESQLRIEALVAQAFQSRKGLRHQHALSGQFAFPPVGLIREQATEPGIALIAVGQRAQGLAAPGHAAAHMQAHRGFHEFQFVPQARGLAVAELAGLDAAVDAAVQVVLALGDGVPAAMVLFVAVAARGAVAVVRLGGGGQGGRGDGDGQGGDQQLLHGLGSFGSSQPDRLR